MESIKYYYSPCNVKAFASFDEKVYLECDGVLRAAYLKRIEYIFKKYDANEMQNIDSVMVFNVAGLGEYSLQAPISVCSKVSDIGIHQSVDSFIRKENNLKWGWLNLEHALPIIFQDVADVEILNKYSSYFEVFRWKWNGIKPEKVYLEFSKVTLTKDKWTTDAIIPANTYASEIECQKANQVSVIEFE